MAFSKTNQKFCLYHQIADPICDTLFSSVLVYFIFWWRMAKVIGIVQPKSGAGRSTIATNLAAVISNSAKTALIDCDLPQGTSKSWHALREAENKEQGPSIACANSQKDLVELVRSLNMSHQYLVLDGPPDDQGLTRTILMLSNLLIIPLKPDSADKWATVDLLDLIEKEKKSRPQLQYRILWNRYQNYIQAGTSSDETAHTAITVSALHSSLGYRKAYPEALKMGRSVLEMADDAAREEVASLCKEIFDLFKPSR